MKIILNRIICFIFIIIYFSMFNLGNIYCQKKKDTSEQTYTNIEAFRTELKSIPMVIIGEKTIDLNSDGKLDYLIYISGDEEILLDVLLAKEDHFVLYCIPQGREYEIIISPQGRYVLRIGQPLYCGYDNSDCYLYLRYKYYEFIENKMIWASDKYPKFYKRLIKIYQSRIKELEENIKINRNRIIYSSFITKYREFIKEAIDIVNNSVQDYSDLSKISGDINELIKKNYSDYLLLNLNDLNPSTKSYYENHIANEGPGIVCKDIDGNNLLDYALLLRNVKLGNNNWILVIFLQKKRGRYEIGYNMDLRSSSGDLFLIPIAPYFRHGQFIENPSVGLCDFNKPTVSVLYWNKGNGKIKELLEERMFLLCQ